MQRLLKCCLLEQPTSPGQQCCFGWNASVEGNAGCHRHSSVRSVGTVGLAVTGRHALSFPRSLTTMVSVWLSQGEVVRQESGTDDAWERCRLGICLDSGSFFEAYGPWLGALAAWGGKCVLCSVPAALWMGLQHQKWSAQIVINV